MGVQNATPQQWDRVGQTGLEISGLERHGVRSAQELSLTRNTHILKDEILVNQSGVSGKNICFPKARVHTPG